MSNHRSPKSPRATVRLHNRNADAIGELANSDHSARLKGSAARSVHGRLVMAVVSRNARVIGQSKCSTFPRHSGGALS